MNDSWCSQGLNFNKGLGWGLQMLLAPCYAPGYRNSLPVDRIWRSALGLAWLISFCCLFPFFSRTVECWMSLAALSPLVLSPVKYLCESGLGGGCPCKCMSTGRVQGKGDVCCCMYQLSTVGVERLGELPWHSGYNSGCLLASACSFLSQTEIQSIRLVGWED